MRLIDYNAAIDRYHKEYKTQDICDGAQDRDFLMRCFDEAETIDAAPVVHGRWGYSSDRPDTIICSCCDRAFDVWKHESKDFFYCPHCGAKMDLPEEKEKHK